MVDLGVQGSQAFCERAAGWRGNSHRLRQPIIAMMFSNYPPCLLAPPHNPLIPLLRTTIPYKGIQDVGQAYSYRDHQQRQGMLTSAVPFPSVLTYIHSANRKNVDKVLLLGSRCMIQESNTMIQSASDPALWYEVGNCASKSRPNPRSHSFLSACVLDAVCSMGCRPRRAMLTST